MKSLREYFEELSTKTLLESDDEDLQSNDYVVINSGEHPELDGVTGIFRRYDYDTEGKVIAVVKTHKGALIKVPADIVFLDASEDEGNGLNGGDYVVDTQDGSGEVFLMRGDPNERRVSIVDKDGRGWNISPHRLKKVTDQRKIAQWFPDEDMEESATKKQEWRVDTEYGIHADEVRRWRVFGTSEKGAGEAAIRNHKKKYPNESPMVSWSSVKKVDGSDLKETDVDDDKDDRCTQLGQLKQDSSAMRDPMVRSEVLRKSQELGCTNESTELATILKLANVNEGLYTLASVIHPDPQFSDVKITITDSGGPAEFAEKWEKLPDVYQKEFGYDLPLWIPGDKFKKRTSMDYASYLKLVTAHIKKS